MEASVRHQEAAKKHLKEFEDEMNSDEEEDDIGDMVLETVFKSYSTNFGQYIIYLLHMAAVYQLKQLFLTKK